MKTDIDYIKPSPNCWEELHIQMFEDFWGVPFDTNYTTSATEVHINFDK